MFAVIKSLDKDRLIMDSRPPNCLEIPLQRWIKSLATGESLCQIRLQDHEVLRSSGNDVRDYYHMFQVSEERKRRNVLTGPVFPAEVRHLSCFKDEFDRSTKLYGALATLAMGDAQAVEIAQTCHLGMALKAGVATQQNLLNLAGFHPRTKDLIGIVIDDYVSMSIVDAETSGPSRGAVLADQMEMQYESVGLIPHKDKSFRDEEQSTFWGVDVDGKAGLVRGSLRRAIPIVGILLRTAKLGHASVGLIQILCGSIVSLFLFRRRFLSILDYLYRACRGRKDSDVIKLSGRAITEILVAAALVPIAVTNLRAMLKGRVCATDASSWGIGAVIAEAPIELVAELHRHSLKKSVWAKLLSPSKAWCRMHEVLDPEDELPGEGQSFKTNPLWLLAARALDYRAMFSEASQRSRHINIAEVRAFLKAERDLGRKERSTRGVFGMDSQVGLGTLIKGRASSRSLNAELARSIGQMVIFDVYPSFMYYDTSSNPADDPTRGVPLRKKSMDFPEWLGPLLSGDPSSFDSWTASVGLGYFELTGLPFFDELLGQEFDNETCVESSVKTTSLAELGLPDTSDSSINEISKLKHSPETERRAEAAEALKLEASLGSAEEDPATRECPESLGFGGIENSARNDGVRKREGFIFHSREGPLSSSTSQKIYDILLKADKTQLLKNEEEEWPSNSPGFIDLYSGERGAAKALHQISGRWVISFDIIYGANQDLNDPVVRSDIELLLTSGAVVGLGAAPVCRSFSVAVTPSIRSKEFPYGKPGVSEKVQRNLEDGNQSAFWIFSLVKICILKGIGFWLENPSLSWLFRIPAFFELLSSCGDSVGFWLADYCRFGKKWRKRTKFFTNTCISGCSTLCNGCKGHIKLRGRSAFHRKAWTLVAQPYPRGVCKALGFALSLHSGVIEYRSFDPSSCARCGNNPGPVGREGVLLESIPLVEAKTASLQAKVWKRFSGWIRSGMSRQSGDCALSNPQLICLLLKEFGNVLYAEGAALYLYRHLAVYVQKNVFGVRPFMGVVWDNVHRWELLEPVVHRVPLPTSVFQALVSLAVLWGWNRFAGSLCIAFYGITRPGEVLRATRKHLVLPSDLLLDTEGPLYLRIQEAKSRRRGRNKVQHASVVDPDAVRFISEVFGHLDYDEMIYPISGSSFRRRWDKLCLQLGIGKTHRLTPPSVRGGGALAEYRAGTDLQRILWRMRIRHLITLEHYVQEVAGESFVADLSSDARRRISVLSGLFKPTLLAYKHSP